MPLPARLLVAVLAVVAGATLLAQEPAAPVAEYIAFRVDEHRLVATTLLREVTSGQARDDQPTRPAARYGYAHFPIPEWWRERPFAEPPLGRWLVHISPGAAIEATAEGVVGGYAQCQEAIGVLLRADPRDSKLLADSPARYFVASPSAAGSFTRSQSILGTRLVPSSPAWRGSVEAVLDDVLKRELPGVIAAAAEDLAKMETSSVAYHRSWARERRRIDAAMTKNLAKREYDVQAFQLGPGGPVYFVRAQWLVQGRQGFAASLWLRTEPRVEILETNLRPADWLRMFEFQGRITRDQMGLVLGVIDRNRDGWGEILFLESGYESFSLSVRSYSPGGFVTAGPEYASGC